MPDRKGSYLGVANAASGIRSQLAEYRPQYGSIRSGMQAYQTAQNNASDSYPGIRAGWNQLSSDWQSEADNSARPDQTYKEGYDPTTVNQMRTAQSDIVAGGRTRAANEINRQVNAQGMGATGAGIRSVMAMEPTWTAKSQAGRRTADIDAAEAARIDYQKNQDRIADDYWKGRAARQYALQGKASTLTGLNTFETGREAFNRNSFLDQLAALDAETGTYRTDVSTLYPEMGAYEGAYQPGFWGKFGSAFATSLGSSLGGGLGGGITGFGSKIGSASAPGVNYGIGAGG